MAVRGGWRPLSGLICEIVNSVGQGNFTFVREKSGKSQGISNTYGCGNHATVMWTDSMETLCWIKNERVWKQYIGQRVDEIRRLTHKDSWRHCPGEINPPPIFQLED